MSKRLKNRNASIKKDKSLDALEKNIKNQNFFNFKEAIQKNNGISIISEIKKASPSAGVLIDNFNHLEIAKMYVENGATCLSVLTEEKHFLGKLEYIQDIKKKFKIPILAKDFFIDPYQIALAKSYGSDCILIIIAALNGSQADEIYSKYRGVEEQVRRATELEQHVLEHVSDSHERTIALFRIRQLTGLDELERIYFSD